MHRRKSHRVQIQADVLLLLSAVWQWDMEPLEMQSGSAKWENIGPGNQRTLKMRKEML